MENRYPTARYLWYTARIGNKKLDWRKSELCRICLLKPVVTLSSSDDLVIYHNINGDGERPFWKSIKTELMKEAERLYPEFKDKIIIAG